MGAKPIGEAAAMTYVCGPTRKACIVTQHGTPNPGNPPSRAWQVSAALLPGVFVFLWSTGFVAGKTGLPYAGPFTFLMLRYAVVIVLMSVIALISRAPWPKLRQIPTIAIGGLFIHAGYLGGVFASLSVGVEAGVAALIAGLQPVLTAALAGPLLGERVVGRQWAGLALGVVGVGLVVRDKLADGLGTPLGILFAFGAMLSITAGTLWQKRFGGAMDLRTGSVVQFIASAIVTLPAAVWLEHFRFDMTLPLALSLGWLCLVLSIGAVTAMYMLIRRGAASEVASLFFLVPPTTALIAWAMFGEKLDPSSLAGMAAVCVSVALVTRKAATSLKA
jgi:drug/metabolite transporter (DMT)-like permease